MSITKAWFISDTHLGHERILEFQDDTRPFSTIEEHDEFIVDRINSKVNNKDTLFILGDFIYKDRSGTGFKHASRLKGRRKVLILGNHDVYPVSMYTNIGFSEIYAVFRHKQFILSHVPVHPVHGLSETRSWIINVHGHLHQSIIDDDRYINVNLDIRGYDPISTQDLNDIIRYRQSISQKRRN